MSEAEKDTRERPNPKTMGSTEFVARKRADNLSSLRHERDDARAALTAALEERDEAEQKVIGEAALAGARIHVERAREAAGCRAGAPIPAHRATAVRQNLRFAKDLLS